MLDTTTFQYCLLWLEEERHYQIKKFDYEGEDDRHTEIFNDKEHPFEKMFWTRQIDQYLYRASTLGLDTMNGRQALAKCAATVVAMLESSVRVYGPLPEPGVASGNNLDKPW